MKSCYTFSSNLMTRGAKGAKSERGAKGEERAKGRRGQSLNSPLYSSGKTGSTCSLTHLIAKLLLGICITSPLAYCTDRLDVSHYGHESGTAYGQNRTSLVIPCQNGGRGPTGGQYGAQDGLHFQRLDKSDRSSLDCLESNEFESVQAAALLSLGEHGPTFLETFADRILEPGMQTSLKCVASGKPLPQITWTRDGQSIPDNSRFHSGDYVTPEGLLVSFVNISSVILEDGGLYRCSATNDVTSIHHRDRLSVTGPPFIRPMKDVTAVAGDTLFLDCPVAGHPIDLIYWERDNLRLPYNDRHKVYPNGTLVMVSTERNADEGKYTCLAIGKEGRRATNSVQVNVRIPPAIDPFVFSKSLHQGQRYTILCSVSKGDLPLKTQWLKDGKEIKMSDFPGITVIHVSQFSSNLVFESLRPTHRGNYTCQASNDYGKASYSQPMVIHEPPNWVLEPTDLAVLQGRPTVIDCQADGFPLPSIRWSKTKEPQSQHPAEYKPVISSPHMRVYENGSLGIHATQRSDSGYYLCQASNGIGAGLTKVIKLTVHVAAHFESKFHIQTVLKGNEARLRCDARGDKAITISWMKDKMPINANDDPRYKATESITDDGHIAEILIGKTDRRDSARYTCLAINSHGKDDTNLQLIIQEPPDPPQNVRVAEYDGRSARLSWDSPYTGNSPMTHYTIQVAIDGGLGDKWTSKGATNSTVSGSETSAHLRNLKPVTRYQARIIAANNIGKSDPSDTIRFTTDEEVPGGPPLNMKAQALGSAILKITWEPPRRDLHFGHIRGYYVGYKETLAESEAFVYKTLETDQRPAGHQVVSVTSHQERGTRMYRNNNNEADKGEETVLTNLKRFTKYTVIIQAFNSKGAGQASEEIVAQTLQNDPPRAPSVRAKSITAKSIQVSWSLPGSGNGRDKDNADKDEPVSGYFLYQKRLDSSDWEELRLSGEKTSHLFDFLGCGTKYQFYVVAFNVIGKSDASDIITVKTEGMAPVAPRKAALISANSSAAIVHLDAWHDGSCSMRTFRIMYKTHKGRQWSTIDHLYLPDDSKQLTLSDLLSGTLYDIKISAVNEAGSTEAQYSFSTDPVIKAPSIVHGNEASSATSPSSSIHLDLGLLLPASISILIVFLVIFMASCWQLRRGRNANSSFYGSAGIYDTSKSNNSGEAIRLSEMEASHGNKNKINSELGANSIVDSGYYPSPYAMTQFNGDIEPSLTNCNINNDPGGGGASGGHCGIHNVDTLRSQTSWKTVIIPTEAGREAEPLYATVKRTPRAPRSDANIYQCSMAATLGPKGSLVGGGSSNVDISGPHCKLYSTNLAPGLALMSQVGQVGPPASSSSSTAFMRLHQ